MIPQESKDCPRSLETSSKRPERHWAPRRARSRSIRGDPRQSWCRDLIRLSLNLDSDGESRARLASHAQQVVDHPAFQEHRDLSRVDGSGGYAVPPAWLMNQYIELARPGRAFANLVQRQPLPGGTDSINIPKLLTGTTTAVQTADNQPVVQQDLTDTFINAPVRTIAGQQAVAIQLIDQSPIAFDDVVFRDLVADHSAQTDKQCLSGTGLNGQVLGVRLTPEHPARSPPPRSTITGRLQRHRQRGADRAHHAVPAARGDRDAPAPVGLVPVAAGRPAAPAVPARRQLADERRRRADRRGQPAGRGPDARAARGHRSEHRDQPRGRDDEDPVYVLRASPTSCCGSRGSGLGCCRRRRRRTSPCSCRSTATWRSLRPATQRPSWRSPG